MNTILEIINNQYWIFFEIAVVLLTTKMFGLLLKKLGLPQVLGALLAGVVIGLLNLLLSKIDPGLFIVNGKDSIIGILASIGVNLIMFSAGMETNISEIKKNGVASIVITALGVVVPLIVGFAISWILPDRLFNQDISIIKQRFFFRSNFDCYFGRHYGCGFEGTQRAAWQSRRVDSYRRYIGRYYRYSYTCGIYRQHGKFQYR